MLLIKNGKVLTMAGINYEQGDILIDKGIIKAVGENLEYPEGAEILPGYT